MLAQGFARLHVHLFALEVVAEPAVNLADLDAALVLQVVLYLVEGVVLRPVEEIAQDNVMDAADAQMTVLAIVMVTVVAVATVAVVLPAAVNVGKRVKVALDVLDPVEVVVLLLAHLHASQDAEQAVVPRADLDALLHATLVVLADAEQDAAVCA